MSLLRATFIGEGRASDGRVREMGVRRKQRDVHPGSWKTGRHRRSPVWLTVRGGSRAAALFPGLCMGPRPHAQGVRISCREGLGHGWLGSFGGLSLSKEYFSQLLDPI